MSYNRGSVSAISIPSNKRDRTSLYGNGYAEEVDETNVLVPDGFYPHQSSTLARVKTISQRPRWHRIGRWKESKGETTPLEYLDQFEETKVRKVKRFVNRDGGGEVPNLTV